jgi:hypothetical protein
MTLQMQGSKGFREERRIEHPIKKADNCIF